MSASDNWGTFATPCPDTNCDGVVEYWNFAADCRGNPPSSGIQCRKCKHKFTKEEWGDKK